MSDGENLARRAGWDGGTVSRVAATVIADNSAIGAINRARVRYPALPLDDLAEVWHDINRQVTEALKGYVR